MRHRTDVALVVLTMATGVLDLTCFVRLGHVFSSVMTGNVVLLGVGLSGEADGGAVALHGGLSLVSYVVGVLLGGWLSGRHADDERGGRRPSREVSLARALGTELVVLLALTVGWELAAGRPGETLGAALLMAAALAMGIQGAVVRLLFDPNTSTTYFTGTLTALVGSLVWPNRAGGKGQDSSRLDTWAFARLLGLATGALSGGALLWGASRWAVPLAMVLVAAATVIELAARRREPAGDAP